MFLKNKNIIFKIRRSKVTDYAALSTLILFLPLFLMHFTSLSYFLYFTRVLEWFKYCDPFWIFCYCAALLQFILPGRVAQLVTCLATDACLTAIPGVASSIPARSHTFVEIDHEIISTVILLPSADSFKKGCCQLQAKVCARITG